MPFFETDGIHFHTLDTGAGLPFLFQHGLGGDIDQTQGIFQPPLAFRLLTLECRGHGKTWPLGPLEKLSFAQFADDLLAFIDQLQLGQVVVGGISMGAGVALNFALRYPQRVRALVLVRPAWLAQPLPPNVQMFPRIAALIRQHGTVRGREVFLHSQAYLDVLQSFPVGAASLAGQFARLNAAESVDLLECIPGDAPNRDPRQWSQIQAPTLVLANDLDPVHPLEYGETLAQAIPGAEFRQITSKEIDARQHSSDIQQAVERFLRKLG